MLRGCFFFVAALFVLPVVQHAQGPVGTLSAWRIFLMAVFRLWSNSTNVSAAQSS